jgi:hypothetical protein
MREVGTVRAIEGLEPAFGGRPSDLCMKRSAMPKVSKLLALLFCLGLLYPLISPSAKADEWDQKTTLTFSGPVEVGNTRLEAGTYVFELADTSDRHVVQIFSEDEKHVYATILAIPDYRVEPTGDTVIKFSETVDASTISGELPAAGVPIKEWFYPGQNFGQEFKVAPVETAAVEPSAPPEAAPEPEPATVAPEQPAPEPEPQTPEATPAPDQSQEATPAPAQPEPPPAAQQEPAPAPTPLPKTASSALLVGLLSGVCFALALGIRTFAKRQS